MNLVPVNLGETDELADEPASGLLPRMSRLSRAPSRYLERLAISRAISRLNAPRAASRRVPVRVLSMRE
jgi:hypothetical protein